MKEEVFGKTKAGKEATKYWLENKNGMKIAVTDFGATLVSIFVPDQEGNLVDVVLGYDSVEGYEQGGAFYGATVGRNANRIGQASFVLNQKTYHLTDNDHGNNLHSGLDFYNKRMWERKTSSDSKITFALFSPDQDQGFPGNLQVEVTYELTEDNELHILYKAVSDQDTLINMTNHSYFNLNGQGSGTIHDLRVRMDADAFTPTDEILIPTGEIAAVDGTPMDFRQWKALGEQIEEDYEPLLVAGGYDHNWALNNRGRYAKVAEAASKQTGIKMDVYTDLPGMQMYTGNFIEEEQGKAGAVYRKRSGVCFETQYFPDAIHKEQFEAPVWKAGEAFQSRTSYCFSVCE